MPTPSRTSRSISRRCPPPTSRSRCGWTPPACVTSSTRTPSGCWRRGRSNRKCRDLSEPTYKFITRLNQNLFAGTPYAHDALGTRESFEKTTGALLKGVLPAMVRAQQRHPRGRRRRRSGCDAREDQGAVRIDSAPSAGTAARGGAAPGEAGKLHARQQPALHARVIAYRLPGTDSPDYAAARVMADVSPASAAILRLVPAGKALCANFELRKPIPRRASVSASPRCRRQRRQRRSWRTCGRSSPITRARGFPAELVEAAKRSEIASRIPSQLDFRSRRRLVAGACRRGAKLARR